MAGIYIHIPFCKQACHYCNFHFSTSMQLKNGFLDALLKEIQLRKDFLDGEPVETIYFGGGTPSLLSLVDLRAIFDTLFQHFSILSQAEVTLEANPDDINQHKLTEWRRVGINRLSIGVQSFFEEDLIWMNRAHNAGQARASILSAQEAGFSNITIDLIFGGPTLTDDHWQQNVYQAVQLKIPHLSCYALTVEPGTALESRISRKISTPVSSEDQAAQFTQALHWLTSAAYEHYEISNYALPGFRSRHNSSYWEGKKYIGFGPSAHSYNGIARQWNVSNNAVYIDSLKNNEVPFETEVLSPVQKLNERIMISLRRKEGLALSNHDLTSSSVIEELLRKAARHEQQGLLTIRNDVLALTDKGKLYADGIASDLFFEEKEIMGYVSGAGS